MVVSLLSFARFVVLFCESWSVVSHERQSDLELIKLCENGAASESEKFRLLCLKARSEQASPVLFKAIIHVVKTAWIDFCESFNSPSKIALLVLFCISGLALPIVRLVAKMAETQLGQTPSRTDVLAGLHGISFEGDGDDIEHSVLLSTGSCSSMGGFGRSMARLPFKTIRRGRGSSPRIVMVSDEENDDMNECHLHKD